MGVPHKFFISPIIEFVNAVSKAFKKALIERVLGAELSHHLGCSAGAPEAGQPCVKRCSSTLTSEPASLS